MTTETKAAHTPGPWTIYEEGRDDNIKVERHGKGSICKVARKGPDSGDRELELANARLISAAPELLEALEAIVASAHNGNEPGQTWIMIAGGLIDDAEAAIRKAKEAQ